MMSDFLAIISHAKKLNRALKDMSIDDIEALLGKLEKILQDRKELAKKQIALAQEKTRNIEQLRQMMAECNITVEELAATPAQAPKKQRQPRAAKYAIVIDGEQITWTGQGKMPNVFKNAAAPIETFLIK